MSLLAPSWAFSGQAIDGTGDPHLARGVHFRVLTNPLLGLPIVPIVVGRIVLYEEAKGLTRRDVTWVDSHGNVLTAPFNVTAGNPVTGYLPLGRTCCWASVEGRAGTLPTPLPPARPPVRPPIIRPAAGDVSPVVIRPSHLGALQPVTEPVVIRPDIFRPRSSAPFRVEGVVATPLGDAPVAIQSRAPYHVYASHIERIVVRGAGTVAGLSWLPAEAVGAVERFRTLPLPTDSGARYAGPADGPDHAKARIQRGAPQRFGMHESPLAAAPTACDLAAVSDEVDRVLASIAEPETTLDRLINDTSAPQGTLTVAETVFDQTGRNLGTAGRVLLMELLQSAVDPGFARWLGYLDVDEQVPGEHDVVAYVVDALFAPDWDRIARLGLDSTLERDAIIRGGVEAVELLAERAPEVVDFAKEVAETGDGPFLFGRVVLAATAAVPLDPPPAPPLDGPAVGAWIPATAPTAIRELTAGLESLVPAAGLASTIAQPAGTKPVPRNPEDTIRRRRLLSPRPDPAVASPTRGLLSDRQVGEQDGSWQLAQLDWFGRWSGWSAIGFGPGARPRPPRPVFTLTTSQPVLPSPPPADARSGTIRVEVSVPAIGGLPPGGRLLDHLELTVTAGVGAPVTTSHPVNGALPPETLVITAPGPALLPTQSERVSVTAVWSDTAGVESDPSAPKSATMYDPRPPAAVVLPPTLAYTARPDATGRARATLTWAPQAGQASFRVFVADETTLRAKLEEVVAGILVDADATEAPPAADAQAILADLDTADVDAPGRAAVWDANRHRLPRRWFRQLTAEPVPVPLIGPVVYHHDVSGSLTVLTLFRVVAVSAASVESDFRTSPMLPRGVPNLLVPPAPAIEVRPVIDVNGNLLARLRVTVPGGPTTAVRYRVRRATATTTAEFMRIVAEGVAFPAAPGGGADHVFQVDDKGDTGTTPAEARSSLVPWVTYNWRVEVQGAPAPGGGPPGEWSSPSPPVTAAIMPPNPPSPVTDITVSRDAAGVHIRFKHPDPLAAGSTLGYTIDAYRQLPGSSLRHLTSVPGQAPPPVGRGGVVTGFFDVVDTGTEAIADTRYQIVVTDPIGRTSPPSTPLEAP